MQVFQENKRYTYSDYAGWNGDERYELIDGVIYLMSPGASAEHQAISGELYRQLANFLFGKSCKVFHPPCDVRLNADSADDTVVQPDLFVVCDKSKISNKGCTGAPDMVIEILSPSTASRDAITKLNKYLQAGVREYWIVDPDEKAVAVHILENGKYTTEVHQGESIIPVHTLDGCRVNMKDVFDGIWV